jgi:hypothetical protein
MGGAMGRRLAPGGLAVLASAMMTAAGCDVWQSGAPEPNRCTGSCCASQVVDEPNPAPTSDAGGIPARPGATPTAASGSVVLAMSTVFFGDTDWMGNPSQIAWQPFGLNIDGKVTTACSTNVCTLVGGSSRQAQVDGYNGIDNSFGSQVVPVLQTLDSTFSQTANADIRVGRATMLIQLDVTGTGASYVSLPGALYRAAPIASPKWDGTDVRNVDDVSLVDGSVSQPATVFASGYMNERVWVGTPPTGTAYLDLLTGVVLGLPPIPIHHVQIVMPVAADGGSATSGILAGVIRTSDLVAWFTILGGMISRDLCGGSVLETVALQIEQASDIMADGTNEPGQTCDGISIGLGFDAVAVQLGRAVSTPPSFDPCSDAGVDGVGVEAAVDGGDGA